MNLTIDIVSDVVCPWCFIGKRRLEAALAMLAGERPEAAVTIRWLPYFLNPDTPPEGEPYRPFLEKKFGGAAQVDALLARVAEAGRSAGIAFAFERIRLRANTLNAHRLIHRLQLRGLGDAVVERLFAAHFLNGQHVGDLDVLADIAAACGDDRAAARAYLAAEEDAETIRAQARQAQASGIGGVPHFVFNGRIALGGAQAPEAMLATIRQALI
jgi:predicted DsbA family dithiol-disulfide isomerase